jgi:hypothetical protein
VQQEKRDIALEAKLVEKFAFVSPVLDERATRLWAAAESLAIGYGGDALVSAATGLARDRIRRGRAELKQEVEVTARVRRPGAGRPRLEATQPGIMAALEALVDPLTRGDPTSPLRWTCKSKAKLAAVLTKQGWEISATTVGHGPSRSQPDLYDHQVAALIYASHLSLSKAAPCQ